MSQARKIYPWITVGILIVGLVILYFPLAWMVSTALKPLSQAFNGALIPSHPTLSNFRQIFSPSSASPVFRWLGNSLIAASCSSVLVVLVDSLAAFSLARLDFPGRRIVFYIAVSSLMIPFIAVLIPLYEEFANLNLLNTYWALILPYGANAFGVFLLYQFFLGVPRELEEAAYVDGANVLQVWWRIFVPNSMAPMATLALITFMNVYNDFLWPLVATTSQNMHTLTVGIALMAIGQYNTNYPLLMALTLCSVVPILLAFIFAQRQLVDGISTTGLTA
jgi:multiple sugar transport system permease protein